MEIAILTPEQLRSRLSDFCSLYRSCFSGYIDENIVENRYLENPYGDLLMCVAIDNDKIVGNYAATPVRMSMDGNIVKAAMFINTMTAPAYAGKGLFQLLANTLYDHLVKEGYSLIYGFPNYMANGIFCSKLGGTDVYEIPTMELELNGQSPEYNSGNIIINPDVASLTLNCSKPFYIVKEQKYLQWRYFDHPTNTYLCISTPNGSWSIYKFYQDMINIAEFNSVSGSDTVDMLNYIISAAAEKNCSKVTIWAEANTPLHFALEKMGFRNKYPITYFALKELDKIAGTDKDISDYRNWHISMGDDNVY